MGVQHLGEESQPSVLSLESRAHVYQALGRADQVQTLVGDQAADQAQALVVDQIHITEGSSLMLQGMNKKSLIKIVSNGSRQNFHSHMSLLFITTSLENQRS